MIDLIVIFGCFLLIAVALIFLYIGYVLGKDYKEKQFPYDDNKPVKPLNTALNKKVKGGIIDYPTQEDIEYTESGEEKVDQERERVFRENFKL